MTMPPFKEYLFDRFIEWEKKQPKKRSSYSAYARWLSNNSLGISIKQQTVSDWINGDYKPKEEKYILVLAEKLGDEIYEILQVSRPDPFVSYVAGKAPNLKELQKRKIEEQIAKYIASNEKESPVS